MADRCHTVAAGAHQPLPALRDNLPACSAPAWRLIAVNGLGDVEPYLPTAGRKGNSTPVALPLSHVVLGQGICLARVYPSEPQR
jgi:hypothetical protein